MVLSLHDLFLPILLGGGVLVYSEVREESVVGFKVSCMLKVITGKGRKVNNSANTRASHTRPDVTGVRCLNNMKNGVPW